MKKSFKGLTTALREIAGRFDDESNKQKLSLVEEIKSVRLPKTDLLSAYHETLVFMMAFSSGRKTALAAEREVQRIASFLEKQPDYVRELFVNSGIPGTNYRAAFSHDCTKWMLTHPDCFVKLDEIDNTMFDLNEALKVTLPAQLRSATTSGSSNDDLLRELVKDKRNYLPFVINELSRLDAMPYIKDHYYDGLGIQTDIVPRNKYFSKAYNRISVPEVFYHSDMIKDFDVREQLDRRISEPATLNEKEKSNVIRVIKNSMALTERETDPATYLKEDSLRLYHLERGLSIALYGMPPERQLPMESYIGYTLFKNGFPAAYAGGWVFGSRSDFGLNIYDHLRGGESAYMVTQILRLYRQVFDIEYFLVEPTQFGLDSPEGIATGVFWFYYKLGFRPVEAAIRDLAKEEHRKIKSIRGYRSSEKILLKFTESDICLNLGKGVQPGVYDITGKIKKMVAGRFRSDCKRAEEECIAAFLQKSGSRDTFNTAETEVLKQVALWAEAMKVEEKDKLSLLVKVVRLKPVDEYECQKVLRTYFGK